MCARAWIFNSTRKKKLVIRLLVSLVHEKSQFLFHITVFGLRIRCLYRCCVFIMSNGKIDGGNKCSRSAYSRQYIGSVDCCKNISNAMKNISSWIFVNWQREIPSEMKQNYFKNVLTITKRQNIWTEKCIRSRLFFFFFHKWRCVTRKISEREKIETEKL